jgi:ATP/maltotriose-dependent transcriptional regulator MalT
VSSTFLSRPRIGAAIEASGGRRAILITAPSGYGKSCALKEYAAEHDLKIYVALAERTSFARFAGDLVQMMSVRVPGMRLSLAGAYERALQRSDSADTLAIWFARHVENIACTIVIDELQNAGDPQIVRFIARAIERSPDTVHWIIGSRTLDDLPVASWLAHEIASIPLDESTMRLTPDEAEAIARLVAPALDPEIVARLHASTQGVVADFLFFARRAQHRGAEHGVTFESAAAQTYEGLDEIEREFVLQTALLPGLDSATIVRAAGPEASVILGNIREKFPEIFDGARYQSRFRAFVREKIAGLDHEERGHLIARAARTLETSGDVAGAIRLFAEAGDEPEILRLIDRYGFNSMESDKSYVLHDAIAALGEKARGANHSVLAVQGIMASLGGKTDMSESLFQNALQSCDVPQQRMRLRYLYAVDLLRRGRIDCIDLLKPDAAFFEAPAEVRVAVMSALGAAYVLAGQMGLARKWVERALVSAEGLGDSVLLARVQHQASFVALHSMDAERAKRLATKAAEVAEREGVFEISAGAYSVLYNVAQDLDDDIEASASYLERIAACGAKCGSVDKQLYAWLAAYEIAIERGDARAALGIERELGEFDVQYSGRLVMQGLLPAKALQLAWYGDFSRAHHILTSSAEQQASTDRQALRWAEIGLYAAAAGNTADAVQSVTRAWRTIKAESGGSNLRFWRARILCALTFLLLGRLRSPRLILNGLRRDVPARFTRTLALMQAVEALVARRGGHRNYDDVISALDTLRRRQSGGLARLLEALPSALVAPLENVIEHPALHIVHDLAAVPVAALAESA